MGKDVGDERRRENERRDGRWRGKVEGGGKREERGS